MSQRDSGYARKELDCYETPAWVTEALLPHIPERILSIWEPACGSGKMLRVFEGKFLCWASDIIAGVDFLKENNDERKAGAIITNPPYTLAEEFIEHALNLSPFTGMLLRTDFDHAKTRQGLFGNHPAFSKKLVLTKRIKWFEDSKGSPSFNHAWYLWDWQHSGPPTLAYA